jgi:hypothetical protein
MYVEEIDEAFSVNDDIYTILEEKPVYLLKKIRIEKQGLRYSFLGGMWYTHDEFSFKQQISLPFPFSTYYTFKILDKEQENKLYRSALYVKTPLFILQSDTTCTAITFDPVLDINDNEIYPFICLEENDKDFVISFYLFTSYQIKTKENAWLGKGRKKNITVALSKEDTFRFKAEVGEYPSWQDAVKSFFTSHLCQSKPLPDVEEIFHKAKKALWRSYDELTGSFIQLPWRDNPGFTFQNSSYSLLSYEAVRLDYFSKWSQSRKDTDLLEWQQKIKNHFTNPRLSTRPLRKGEGLIWYNMTNLTKKGLTGYFYMDCGYAGYPGGQATTVYHLLHHLKRNPDESLQERVHQTVRYIISTQHDDGSWPMAIRQQGIIRFRPEKLEQFVTYGGTGEAVRALFLASEVYDDETYKEAAKKGLAFLTTVYPICYQGLRDIGIHEAEAFSAVSIINAFLDGYDTTKNEEYRSQAFTYALYLITWIYTYNTKHWNLSYTFHPISYSITPRVSPYETAWVVSLFLRLSTYADQSFWKNLATICYHSVIPFISKTGGLSEGVFPRYQSSLKPLPMEQTFATVELMQASFQFMKKKGKEPTVKKQKRKDDDFEIIQDNDILTLFHKKQRLCSIDASQCKITYLKDVSLGPKGIGLSFNGPYRKRKQIKQKLILALRGKTGKYLLGAKDALYAITGVKAPKKIIQTTFDLFSKHVTSSSITIISNIQAAIKIRSQFHEINLSIHLNSSKDTIHIDIDPLNVSVLTHDLFCNGVFIPVIDAPAQIIDDENIQIQGCLLKGQFPSITKKDGLVAIDRTYETNWTHGGIYSTSLHLILKK